MKKPRVMVALLWSGYYLTANGDRTTDRTRAARFSELDAAKFLPRIGRLDRDDPLRSLSWEMLPKKTPPTFLSGSEQLTLIARLKIERVLAEADRYERLSEGYKAQARYAEESAVRAREKAAELRRSILGGNTPTSI